MYVGFGISGPCGKSIIDAACTLNKKEAVKRVV